MKLKWLISSAGNRGPSINGWHNMPTIYPISGVENVRVRSRRAAGAGSPERVEIEVECETAEAAPIRRRQDAPKFWDSLPVSRERLDVVCPKPPVWMRANSRELAEEILGGPAGNLRAGVAGEGNWSEWASVM